MLRKFLERALELGAEGLEICYKDRQERIFAVRDPISVGIGAVPCNSKESRQIFA